MIAVAVAVVALFAFAIYGDVREHQELARRARRP
jgi:hypothetical protein